MEKRINTTKTELNTVEELEDFLKIEVFYKYMEAKLESNQRAIQVEELQATIEQLREMLQLGQSKTYGTPSEKHIDPEIQQMSFFDEENLGVFNEAEQYVEVEKKTHVRRKKGQVGANKPCFDHLPVEEVIEEFSKEDQFYNICHGPLREMKTIERVEICIKPAQLYKKRSSRRSIPALHAKQTGITPLFQAPKSCRYSPAAMCRHPFWPMLLLKSTGKKYRFIGWKRTSSTLELRSAEV